MRHLPWRHTDRCDDRKKILRLDPVFQGENAPLARDVAWRHPFGGTASAPTGELSLGLTPHASVPGSYSSTPSRRSRCEPAGPTVVFLMWRGRRYDPQRLSEALCGSAGTPLSASTTAPARPRRCRCCCFKTVVWGRFRRHSGCASSVSKPGFPIRPPLSCANMMKRLVLARRCASTAGLSARRVCHGLTIFQVSATPTGARACRHLGHHDAAHAVTATTTHSAGCSVVPVGSSPQRAELGSSLSIVEPDQRPPRSVRLTIILGHG